MNKFPRKRISWIFQMMKINRMMLFINLFMWWPSYHLVTKWTLQAWNAPKRGRPGLSPWPHCGSLRHSPDPLFSWGWEAQPLTPLRELTTLPRPSIQLGMGDTSTFFPSGTERLQCRTDRSFSLWKVGMCSCCCCYNDVNELVIMSIMVI